MQPSTKAWICFLICLGEVKLTPRGAERLRIRNPISTGFIRKAWVGVKWKRAWDSVNRVVRIREPIGRQADDHRGLETVALPQVRPPITRSPARSTPPDTIGMSVIVGRYEPIEGCMCERAWQPTCVGSRRSA